MSWTAWTPRFECCLATCPYFGQSARSSNTRSCSFKIRTKKVVGIVTTTDLSVQLRDLTDAFLLMGNIERQIRRLMGNRFELDVLRSFVPRDSSRVVQGVEDLSFGEYLRLLQVPEHWSKLGLKVDSTVVLKRLEQVRTIRNAVMHFRADSINGIDLDSLRLTEAFLASLSPA